MRNMLEATKFVLESRRAEIPDNAVNQKICRDYFESGCICVLEGDISVPKTEPDDVACLFYIMWCGCHRHSDYHATKPY